MSDKKEWEAFEATFNRILSTIIPENPKAELKETMDWLKNVILYNVPHGKRNRGLAVVDTVRLIAEQEKRTATEEELELARVLGWNVEFLQAYFLVVDDMMDQSITRRGQPCWYKREEVGLMSCNDAILLDQENFHILRHYFADKKYYKQVFDLIHECARLTAYGQCMDTMSNPPNRGPQFDLFTPMRYYGIVKYKTAYYSFVLPVRLAMYMCAIDSEHEHKLAEEILVKIGHLFQVQDDFLDCWGDPAIIGKIGTDIEEGKCSWPAMTALQMANDTQLQKIKQNFAKRDGNCVRRVKEVYNELKLKDIFLKEEEQQYKDICEQITALKATSKLSPAIFTQFLNKIYKREK